VEWSESVESVKSSRHESDLTQVQAQVHKSTCTLVFVLGVLQRQVIFKHACTSMLSKFLLHFTPTQHYSTLSKNLLQFTPLYSTYIISCCYVFTPHYSTWSKILLHITPHYSQIEIEIEIIGLVLFEYYLTLLYY
jgi:hypothetical protein